MMPKLITRWQCSYCKRMFETRQQADAHEAVCDYRQDRQLDYEWFGDSDAKPFFSEEAR